MSEMSRTGLEQDSKKPLTEVEELRLEIYGLRQRLESGEEFMIETRMLATYSSLSLPYIVHQHRRLMAETLAITNSLTNVQKEVSERGASFDAAMRERARHAEDADYLKRNMLAILGQFNSVSSENRILKENIRQLNLSLNAKEQIIAGTEGIVQAIQQMIREKQLPEDVIAKLRELFADVPKRLEETSQQPPGTGEEEKQESSEVEES